MACGRRQIYFGVLTLNSTQQTSCTGGLIFNNSTPLFFYISWLIGETTDTLTRSIYKVQFSLTIVASVNGLDRAR